MTGRQRCGVRVFACAWFVGSVAIAPAAAAGIAGCDGSDEPYAVAQAAGALDAITMRLTDGREVRLAGIALPANSGELSKSALGDMVAGRRVALHGSGRTDRYGRLVAQVTLVGDKAGWVQGELVRAGLVLAAPASGSPDCAAALIGRENIARRERAGLWGEGTLAFASAAAAQSLLTSSGDYAVVEGTVLRVGEASGRIFLDFGRRFGRDFSLVVPREAQASFAKAGLDLRALSGKRVRARGVLFEQGGPAMEIRTPAALEVIGAGGA